jgi:hypothetical protein
MVKQFTTAAKKAAYPTEWIEFEIVEPVSEEEIQAAAEVGTPPPPPRVFTCRAVAEPSSGQVAFLMARQSQHVGVQDRVAALLNFFDSALEDETQSYISNRLLDPQDPFGLDEIQEILGFLMEEWSSRPTRSSTASIPPPPPTGPYSTPPTPASTS